MIKQLFIFSLVIFAIVAAAEEKPKKPEVPEVPVPTDVVTITEKNWEETVKSGFVLVEFYAPWCGHCKSLAPEYEKLATSMKSYTQVKIVIAKVDVTENRPLGDKAGIKGFPTLKLYKDGKLFKDYASGRNAIAMEAWLKKKTGPPAKTLKGEEVDQFVKDLKNKAIVGRFKNKDSATYKIFLGALNEKALEAWTAGEVFDENLISESVTLYRPHNSEPAVLKVTAEFTVEAVTAHVVGNGFPLVEEIGQASWSRFLGAGIPIAFTFVDPKQEDAEFTKLLTQVAESAKGKIKFGTFDGVKFKRQVTMMRLPEDVKFPAFSVIDAKANKFYPYTGKNTAEELIAWAKGITDGTIKPNVKSEEIPTEQKEAVIKLVGKSFESIVLDDTKDVLVEFYAPWCGHCKKLAPEYEAVAKKLKSNTNLVIAKIDMTANDIDLVQIKGYPTLFFWPSNSKAKPLAYDGGRDAAGVEAYLRKNAVASKDGMPPVPEVVPTEAPPKAETTTTTEKVDTKKDEL